MDRSIRRLRGHSSRGVKTVQLLVFIVVAGAAISAVWIGTKYTSTHDKIQAYMDEMPRAIVMNESACRRTILKDFKENFPDVILKEDGIGWEFKRGNPGNAIISLSYKIQFDAKFAKFTLPASERIVQQVR